MVSAQIFRVAISEADKGIREEVICFFLDRPMSLAPADILLVIQHINQVGAYNSSSYRH